MKADVLKFALAVVWLFPAQAEAGGPGELGNSLRPDWDERVLRILDRTGRPDPRGPLLQRFEGDSYPEYQLDVNVARFPLAGTLDRVRRPEALELWIQSIDEFTLATRASLEKHVRHDLGHFGFRYDGFVTRNRDTHLLRFDFAFDDVVVDGLSANLRFYPRWEKDDSDVEVRLGYRVPELAQTSLRVVALDVFTNASGALARSRGGSIAYDQQHDPPLLVLTEVSTERFFGLRAEGYSGLMVEHRTSYHDDFDPEASHQRRESAQLAGGLIEWMPWARFGGGVSALVTETEFERIGATETVRVLEHDASITAYLLARPVDRLTLEGFVQRRSRPERVDDGSDPTEREDSAWLASVRGIWMFGRVGGLDLGVLRLDRRANTGTVSGTNHRLTTRCALRLGDLWATFGVGWDLDANGQNIYDGAGGTIRADF